MDWADSAWPPPRPDRRIQWAVIITALTDIQEHDPSLSFQQQISPVCRKWYLELRIAAIPWRHYLSEDVPGPKNSDCVHRLFFFKTRLVYSLLNSLLAGCPKYLLSKRSTEKVQNNQWCKIGFKNNQIGPPLLCFTDSLHWLPTDRDDCASDGPMVRIDAKAERSSTQTFA